MGLQDIIKNALNQTTSPSAESTGGLGWFDAAKMGSVGTILAIAVVAVWPAKAAEAADWASWGQTICIGLAAGFGAFVVAARKLKK